METVLVVGSTGNIGVSVIIAALHRKLNVLAVVRNKASADKIFQHIGTEHADRITTVEADVTSEDAVQKVIDRVRSGKLPSFQHVYSAVGFLEWTSPIQNLDMSTFRQVMKINLEANFRKVLTSNQYMSGSSKIHL